MLLCNISKLFQTFDLSYNPFLPYSIDLIYIVFLWNSVVIKKGGSSTNCSTREILRIWRNRFLIRFIIAVHRKFQADVVSHYKIPRIPYRRHCTILSLSKREQELNTTSPMEVMEIENWWCFGHRQRPIDFHVVWLRLGLPEYSWFRWECRNLFADLSPWFRRNDNVIITPYVSIKGGILWHALSLIV